MKQSAILFCFSTAFILMASSCNSVLQKDYEFHYYPEKNIYYDVGNKEYIYSLDGGQTWDSLFVASGKEPATLGNKQVLHSESHAIWLNNAQHVQQYNGHIINVLASDTAVLNQGLAAERKVKRTVNPAPQNKEPEKKPGFFKRLFGKKNKD
ncbi:hypothetical protein [Parafilimonas sp.]|uniref:hypothetical protein n=1 Tax=Parafilimonas sp. TaxID=1969739 RepID=UPI0039E690C7